MASSIEATGGDHDALAAQNATGSVLFPTPPSLSTPVNPSSPSRARAESQSHFRLRPALAAFQNTFISRRRASSVSDGASQHSNSIAHSPHLTRFVGLGMEPRARTSSTATIVPPNMKRCPSALDFPILESPDEAMSRAPRIPSFHMDSEFGHDLGLSLGLNPRFSAASTVRAHSLSLTPEESRVVKDFAQNHRVAPGAPKTLAPLSDDDSAQDTHAAWSAPVHTHARDADLLTQPAGGVASAPIPTSNAALSTSSLTIDAAVRPVAETAVAAESSVHTSPTAELARQSPSHAQRETDLYLEGVRALGGPLPASTVFTGFGSRASSPIALRSPLISPVRSRVVSPARSTAVSPVRSSISAVSPKQSVAMGTAPSSPLYPLPSPTHLVPASVPKSPSYTAAIPFPSAEDNESYVSDDASGLVSQYAYSQQSGYDTPALYTGTTNTSPTLSVTRVPGEAPPALRLGPGMSFAGVGTYAGGGAVQGGVFFGTGDAGLLSPGRPRTVDSGVSGFGKLEFERDGDSLHLDSSRHSTNAESSGRSIRAESSEQSTHAESSRSGHAESSSGIGIRARVSSLRNHQTLSALIPAFMKRARRKSKMAREEVEEVEKPRGRKDKKGKRGGEQAARHSESRPRTESSRVRTEASHPRTDSVSSSCPVSDDEEEDVSPVSSHLDLLSADPFASTVALKVGAWSEMYAGVASQGRRKSSSVPRDSGSSKTFSDHLPPIIDSTSADYNSDVNLDCASSLYDDDSEEESSIRIYSHGRGRSLSQPDVYTIPIEPLHQSNTAKRSGSSLGGRRRRPALPPRPSLPTLSTLSRANVVIPMPRTTAAARFPAEPWNAIEQGAGASSPSRPLSATRGLGSLVLPVPGSPGRGAIPFPRSPMRSRMGSIVGMGSESSIAEDEDEDEEDEDQTGSWKGTPSVAGGSEVWWSGPSSRGDSCRSSRRGSFTSSAAAEDEELEEVTVSMAVQDVAVRDSVASTARVNRDSVTASEASDRLSQGSVDVSSDAFLQKLDELDASVPTTPPPSDRSSSEVSSSEPSVELLEMPIGVGPRHPPSGAGGMNGGGASAGGYPGDGWKSGSAAQGGFGGNAPRRPAAESTESSSESESDEPFARRGRDARGPTKPSARSQSMPRQPAPLAKAANRQTAPAKDTSDESDDDVPLAQRIPTALKAQKSIRVQDKAEREERRQKRMERMRRRAADKAAPTGGEGGVAAGDLAQRLLSVQVGGEGSRNRSPLPSPRVPLSARPFPPESATSSLFPMSDARSRTVSNVSHMTRSRTHTRNPSTEQPQAPLPAVPEVSVSRSGTMSKRRPSAPEAPVSIPRTSLSRNGTVSKSRPSQEEPRTSLSRSGTAYKHRGGSKTDDEGEGSRFQRSRSIRDPSSARPPMPPMPPVESIPMSARRPSHQESAAAPLVVEQRIYIGDRQKFVVVDVGAPGLTAKDIVESAKQRGELEAPGAGGWHLWEQSNECGMERPVRDFEFVSDVLKAWNAEKRVNVLIIRRSQLCGLLKPENIPTSSPIMSGWVMWASKPGKWSKRWLELKEHSLYVSKSDKPGKEQTFLCGVSNFDAYVVTHIQRAPKGFVFATKSTEGSGVFEKEEDSSHIFSCDREIGEVWLNKILLARSYVLQQERSILPRPSNAGSLAHSKSLLSRSGTKKSTVSSRSAASQNQQPLVQDLYSSPFSGGSLLAKAAANGA